MTYLVAVAVYSFPSYQKSGEWGEYVGIIGASVLLFLLLLYVTQMRDKFRKKQRMNDGNETK